LALNNTNNVTDTDGVGNDLNSSSITQAEVIISNSTTTTLTQDTTNNITDTQLANSSIEQAKVAIGDSNIGGIGIDIDTTNDITNTNIDNYSNVSQNGLRVCQSTVNGLDVDQDNDIENSSISNSDVTQGDINIGSMENCEMLARADHAHKSY
jgi:hypothetical protein